MKEKHSLSQRDGFSGDFGSSDIDNALKDVFSRGRHCPGNCVWVLRNRCVPRMGGLRDARARRARP